MSAGSKNALVSHAPGSVVGAMQPEWRCRQWGPLPGSLEQTYLRLSAEASAAIRMGETRKAMSRVAFTVKGEKRLGASPNRFPGCVLEVVLKY